LSHAITEKGIHDSIWCPVLWNDTSGNDKRVKPLKKWTIVPQIWEVLEMGKNNKTALLRERKLSRRAVPYQAGGNFWLEIESLDDALLLAISEFELTPYYGADKTLIVRREHNYPPRTEEHYEAEKHIHQLLLAFLQKNFPQCTAHVVRSTFPGRDDLETDYVDRTDFGKALSWVSDLVGMWDGGTSLVPNHQNCARCWFKECTSRVQYKPIIENPTSGGSSVSSFI